MPELAEVEFYRTRWNSGVGERIARVLWHPEKRVFRGIDRIGFVETLTSSTLAGSEARAKQILVWFSRGKRTVAWLGVHLGMTGKLTAEPADFTPGKHDHLALFTRRNALVFTDPRTFGRIRFHLGVTVPDWWEKLPPAVTSPAFTLERLRAFFLRRARLAVKAALLVQEMFPGIGNWMADEILWRARIAPTTVCGKLSKSQVKTLWRETREVCRIAMETIAVDFADPPAGWFFHVRWTGRGHCPRCDTILKTATIGDRTTRWCPRCQRSSQGVQAD